MLAGIYAGLILLFLSPVLFVYLFIHLSTCLLPPIAFRAHKEKEKWEEGRVNFTQINKTVIMLVHTLC